MKLQLVIPDLVFVLADGVPCFDANRASASENTNTIKEDSPGMVPEHCIMRHYARRSMPSIFLFTQRAPQYTCRLSQTSELDTLEVKVITRESVQTSNSAQS